MWGSRFLGKFVGIYLLGSLCQRSGGFAVAVN